MTNIYVPLLLISNAGFAFSMALVSKSDHKNGLAIFYFICSMTLVFLATITI